MSIRIIKNIRSTLSASESDTFNRKIFAAAVVVGLATIFVKLASLIKEMIVAGAFGRGDNLDAFLIAFLLPSFAINVIGGSFNVALIPTFIEVRERKGNDAAQTLFSNVVVASSLLLFSVALILAFSAPVVLPYLCMGFNHEKFVLTERLFFSLLPVLVINGLAITWSAVLNAGERFVFASLVSIVVPLVIVITLVMGGKTLGIYSLSLGTVGGVLLQAILLAASLKRHGVTIMPRWYGMDPALRMVMKQYAPAVAGAVLMSSTMLVDQAMGASLESGSVAALNYGNKIVAVVLSLGATALGTAALPYFSRMVANGDWNGIRRTLKVYFRLIAAVTIPITILLIYFSEDLIALLFERGSFQKADTQLVGVVQSLFLLQTPFYIIGMLYVRLISALKANYIFLWGNVISVTVNVVLNYVFMKWIGVAGIALSTSVVYVIASAYLYFMLLRLLAIHENQAQKV
jgi:putative peptidoglycan lipid II flippase